MKRTTPVLKLNIQIKNALLNINQKIDNMYKKLDTIEKFILPSGSGKLLSFISLENPRETLFSGWFHPKKKMASER